MTMKTVNIKTTKSKLLCLFLLVLAAGLPIAVAQQAAPASAASQLAPTGKLRVGVYRGSPTSILPGNAAAENRGLGYDLGREFAEYLQVPFEPVIFAKNADVLAAIKAGSVDITFTNASPERARDLDFSAPLLRVEQSCLVPAGSTLLRLADVDTPGIHVGVSTGSTSEKAVGARLKQGQLVVVPTLDRVVEMLKSGELQAFSTNKAILYELSERLPGSRVLEGAWGYESFAAGIPKGREKAMPVLNQFLKEARSDGRIDAAITRAGLHGTVPPQ